MLTLSCITLTALLFAALGYIAYIRHKYIGQHTRLAALSKVLQQESAEYARELDEVHTRKEWYQRLFNNTEDIVFVYGITPDGWPGNLLDVNNLACSMLGYPKQDLINLTQADIQKEQDAIPEVAYSDSDSSSGGSGNKQGRFASRASRLLVERILQEKDIRYSGTYVTKTGQEFPVEVAAHRIDLKNQPLILCVAHDITNRRRTQSALSDSEERFRNFFASSPNGLALYDRNRVLLDVNTACLRMLGVPTMEEFRQINLFDNPFVPADAKKKFAAGDAVDYETTWDFDEVRRRLLFITSKTGQSHFEIMIHVLGHDRDFRVKGYIIQVQDISERRKAQIALRQSEKMLRQSEKMEALGSMAGGIAHDFNNILTPLLGYSEIALRSVPTDGAIFMYLQEILKASHRAKELVTQILNFSRRQDKEGRPLHLIPIIKEVLTLIRTSMPPSIEIQRILKTERDIVLADATQMHQVFMNLCTNAWHAMRDQPAGTLEVRVTEFLLDQHTKSPAFAHLAPGRYLRASVRDTGSGIDANILERIFDPFFTTKKKGEGTGLGLSVVHGIISAAKGVINVETEVGKGSTFNIILPLLEDEVDSLVAESSKPLPTGSERILIVDDDSEIAVMVAHMLASLGYHPEMATKGHEAIAKFCADPHRYDLVITDQIMPGMSGTQLAMQLLEARRTLPIILCTGFADAASTEEVRALGIRALVMKPIVMSDLAEIVRKALDEYRK
jgi:PAS domain S-box-containing protein